MDKIKKIGRSTKNFVVKHKVAIAVTATALICGKLNKMALHDHDQFLKEHDLYDEYYTLPE